MFEKTQIFYAIKLEGSGALYIDKLKCCLGIDNMFHMGVYKLQMSLSWIDVGKLHWLLMVVADMLGGSSWLHFFLFLSNGIGEVVTRDISKLT